MQTVEQINIESKLWRDHRGWATNLFAAVGINLKSIGDFHIVSIKPGKIRGNHFHKNGNEWLLIIGGKANLFWRAAGDNSTHKIEVTGNSPVLYKIPRNIEHAVINDDQHEIYLIAFSDTEARETVKSADLI